MTPMPRTKRGRLRQLEHWLNDRFPTGRRTTVTVCKMHGDLGDVCRVGNQLRLRIHSKLTWEVAILILFEEWAHAMSWPLANIEYITAEHSEEWGIAYARIRRAFHDEDGWKESRDYPED